ncbi:hypothetical protein EYC80_009022 [Monilinia laxa]|uniref:Uncharacterized protein n=1 Tax=Monilinia laxa TaxID=61186 RepID=A0A5N6K257_MONLA|nr:hypothetical protein EYC80_009022 [Monilinia laxa]
MPSTHFSAKYSSIDQGIVDPILLKLSNVPSPNFTELNLIIRGSRPSVVRTLSCVLLEASYLMTKLDTPQLRMPRMVPPDLRTREPAVRAIL